MSEWALDAVLSFIRRFVRPRTGADILEGRSGERVLRCSFVPKGLFSFNILLRSPTAKQRVNRD
jgi:hypothetical protein